MTIHLEKETDVVYMTNLIGFDLRFCFFCQATIYFL